MIRDLHGVLLRACVLLSLELRGLCLIVDGGLVARRGDRAVGKGCRLSTRVVVGGDCWCLESLIEGETRLFSDLMLGKDNCSGSNIQTEVGGRSSDESLFLRGRSGAYGALLGSL